MQTRHWCFTINNWTTEDEDRLKQSATGLTYIVFGYETGEAGTHHLQGYVVFPKVKRMREAKNTIGFNAHLEPKRGTPEQAASYCKKDGLYWESGMCPVSPGTGGQFQAFVEWALRNHEVHGRAPSDREVAQAFPSLFVRYGRKLQELAKHHCPLPSLVPCDSELRPWQQQLEEKLLAEPTSDRVIDFFIDEDGGKGKSFFQRYMLSNYPDKVQVLSAGKRDDIAYAIEPDKSIFLFNIPRKSMEFFNYACIEQLKDRLIFSPKYDSATKVLMKNPHVVVFSNEDPDLTKMTGDRYNLNYEF